jgi:imidazolonepropionase
MIEVDLLIRNIRQLVNPAGDGPVRGRELNSVRVLENVWLGGKGETINFIGYESDFNKHCRLGSEAQVVDGSDFVVLPGFVDPHTHLPFAGERQDEFQQKLQGVTYREIAARGGGIRRTVQQTREISPGDLIALCERRLDAMLLEGTTTVEAKSGYGLDRDTEIKQLEALQALNAFHPVEIVPTYMGAHEIPDGYRSRDYLDFILRDVLPDVRRRNLAEFVDIFCEEGYFSVPEAEDYLDRAAAEGFRLKIHADEFSSNGAASLAVRKKAVSAEHLIAATDEELELLAPSSTCSVLLPGVSFFLKLGKYAPARKIIERGGILALGTDFNPGSSMISSQLFIFWLGVFELGLSIEEALNTVTINAACAVGRPESVGSIAVGKKMDVLLLDIPDYRYLAYHPGIHPVHTVFKSGESVVRDRRIIYKE